MAASGPDHNGLMHHLDAVATKLPCGNGRNGNHLEGGEWHGGRHPAEILVNLAFPVIRGNPPIPLLIPPERNAESVGEPFCRRRAVDGRERRAEGPFSKRTGRNRACAAFDAVFSRFFAFGGRLLPIFVEISRFSSIFFDFLSIFGPVLPFFGRFRPFTLSKCRFPPPAPVSCMLFAGKVLPSDGQKENRGSLEESAV